VGKYPSLVSDATCAPPREREVPWREKSPPYREDPQERERLPRVRGWQVPLLKAHKLLHHSILGSREIKRRTRLVASTPPWCLTQLARQSVRKSTPPQNRQLVVEISNSEQQVDDFLGDSTPPWCLTRLVRRATTLFRAPHSPLLRAFEFRWVPVLTSELCPPTHTPRPLDPGP
jgi:hypothetical protein